MYRHIAVLGKGWHPSKVSVHDSPEQAWDESGRLRMSGSCAFIACGRPRSAKVTKRNRKGSKTTDDNYRHIAELDNSWHPLNEAMRASTTAPSKHGTSRDVSGRQGAALLPLEVAQGQQ